MSQDRRAPDADRLVVARLTATANRHSRWRELSEDETSAAIAELQKIAVGRCDLLAEVAGILIGAHEGDLDEPRARAAAELCRLAGADEDLIPHWAEEGRRRAAARGIPPFSRSPRHGPRRP